jgi:hypothetical protein
MTKYLKPKNYFSELQKAHKAFLTNADKSGYLSSKTTDGLLVEKEKNFLKKILNDKYPLEESIDGVERLSYVYLLHTEYCLNVAKDKDKALESLKKSYGYHILTTYLMVSCEKVFTSQKSFGQENMAFGLSLHFLFSGTLEKSLLSFLLKKLEPSSVIQSPFMFILKLMEAETVSDLEFSSTLEYPYNTLQEVEKSEIDTEIDYLVSLLCETHIELSKEDEFFSNPMVKIFPYEILLWLKLREKSGLKNPKRYSHPMMNTPLTKMFMDISEPLHKPKKLPLAKMLLEKLKQKCPQIKVPDWVNETDEVTSNQNEVSPKKTYVIKAVNQTNSKTIKSNQTVQKSGTYQAFLPPNHPLAKKVHQMPESKRLGAQGVSMLPLGLSAEDEDKLRWEWIGV